MVRCGAPRLTLAGCARRATRARHDSVTIVVGGAAGCLGWCAAASRVRGSTPDGGAGVLFQRKMSPNDVMSTQVQPVSLQT
jgi:hypothetical protein